MTSVIVPISVVPTIGAPVPQKEEAAFPITKEIVVKECVKHGFYRTPSCNDKLYLHHKGFDKIAGLEEYINCKVLWLEGNCIHKIEGLESMYDSLRQLYIHQNMLDRIENLHGFGRLDGINLSDNTISRIEGFGLPEGAEPAMEVAPESDEQQKEAASADDVESPMQIGPSTKQRIRPTPLDTLTTLQISNNKLKSREDIAGLLDFKILSMVDLSNNKLECGADVVEVLSRMPELKTLYLSGNPCVRTIPSYRKTLISKCTKLMYLDDRPVFEDERRVVQAWANGGLEAEKAERQLMAKETREKHEQHMADFREMIRVAQRQCHGDRVDSESSGDEDSCPSSSSSDSADEAEDPRVAGTAAAGACKKLSDSAPSTEADNKKQRDASTTCSHTPFWQRNHRVPDAYNGGGDDSPSTKAAATRVAAAAPSDGAGTVTWGQYQIESRRAGPTAATTSAVEAAAITIAAGSTSSLLPVHTQRHVDPRAPLDPGAATATAVVQGDDDGETCGVEETLLPGGLASDGLWKSKAAAAAAATGGQQLSTTSHAQPHRSIASLLLADDDVAEAHMTAAQVPPLPSGGFQPLSEAQFDAVWNLARRCPDRVDTEVSREQSEPVIAPPSAVAAALLAADDGDTTEDDAPCWIPGRAT